MKLLVILYCFTIFFDITTTENLIHIILLCFYTNNFEFKNMLLLTLYFILVHFIVQISSTNILIEDISQKDVFCSCFTCITNKYFTSRSNIVIETNRNRINCLATPKMSIDSNNLISEELTETPDGYIISYDHLNELNNTLNELRVSPGFSNKAKCLIVANSEYDLAVISIYLWDVRLYKSIIFLPTKYMIELYELNLINSKCGTDIKPKKINECRNGTYKYDLRLFSVDMKTNFHKCPLRVIWTETPPWVFHVNKSNPGIFIELLNMVGEVSEFQIVYMPETSIYKEELGSQYSIQTMIEDLHRDYADVFVGLVGTATGIASRLYLETTSIIYDDNLYFVVPKPQMIPYWKTLTKLYSPTNWIIAIVLFILVSCLFTLLALTTKDKTSFGNLGKNVLHIFSINLNMAVNTTPHSLRLRLILGSILIYSIITAAVIKGKFYSFIRNPLYESPITNLEELVDSDVPIKISGGMKIVFMFNGPVSARVLNRVEELPTIDLLENSIRAYDENFATVIDRGVLVMHPNIREKMLIFDLLSFQTCFIMQSQHVLYEYFDKTIQMIIECGFMEKLISNMKFKYSLQQYVKEENPVFRITMTHLEGAFFVLILGYTLGFSFFIFEFAYFHLKKCYGKLPITNYKL